MAAADGAATSTAEGAETVGAAVTGEAVGGACVARSIMAAAGGQQGHDREAQGESFEGSVHVACLSIGDRSFSDACPVL